jgi:hypothetical protein
MIYACGSCTDRTKADQLRDVARLSRPAELAVQPGTERPDPIQVAAASRPAPKSLGIDMEFPTAAASEPDRESARSGEGTCGTLGF